jgi:hypothetical protein
MVNLFLYFESFLIRFLWLFPFNVFGKMGENAIAKKIPLAMYWTKIIVITLISLLVLIILLLIILIFKKKKSK